MERNVFITAVVESAKARGLAVSRNRAGLASICFNQTSNKSLHADHLGKLFDLGYSSPCATKAQRSVLVNQVAPGRPCTHRRLREIVESLFLADLVSSPPLELDHPHPLAGRPAADTVELVSQRGVHSPGVGSLLPISWRNQRILPQGLSLTSSASASSSL